LITPSAIPLSLYLHLPWCTQKCPYCDFNSHEGFTPELQGPYVSALLQDFDSQLPEISGRLVESIFIGGGTPSLFSGEWIQRLLSGLAERMPFAPGAEITLESNPGSAERGRYQSYLEAGVTRLSIGVQSFNDGALGRLGRIHSSDDARQALHLVSTAGFQNWNIDLMHGLPGQTTDTAAADLLEALALSAGHISWYQLTIERNTRFWTSQPELPSETTLEAIQSTGEQLLSDARYHQYEVSAYCRPGYESRHNLNYWGFGDYVGLGAGAHGKISRNDGQIIRTQRTRSPADYLALITNGLMPAPRGNAISQQERVVEYVMNALRLKSGSPVGDFTQRTGLPLRQLERAAEQAQSRGWIQHLDSGSLRATPLGYQFLDSVVASFL